MDYVDALLRKGGLPEPPEEREIEGRLDDIITLCVSSPCIAIAVCYCAMSVLICALLTWSDHCADMCT